MNAPGASVKADADRLADFVLFTQRSCILNLSTELNKGNVSFPQFFLLTYLSSEEYLTMSDIAKKMGHSTAAATGLVDRLEKLVYVERVHAAEPMGTPIRLRKQCHTRRPMMMMTMMMMMMMQV